MLHIIILIYNWWIEIYHLKDINDSLPSRSSGNILPTVQHTNNSIVEYTVYLPYVLHFGTLETRTSTKCFCKVKLSQIIILKDNFLITFGLNLMFNKIYMGGSRLLTYDILLLSKPVPKRIHNWFCTLIFKNSIKIRVSIRNA